MTDPEIGVSKQKVASGDIKNEADFENWLRTDYPNLTDASIDMRLMHYRKGTYGQPGQSQAPAQQTPFPPTPPVSKSKAMLGLYTCTKIMREGYGSPKIEKLKQEFQEIKDREYQLETSRDSKAITNRAYKTGYKKLEKQAKTKLKSLGQLEEKIEKAEEKAEKAESKKTSKKLKTLGNLVKNVFKGTGKAVDNLEHFFKYEFGPEKLKKYAKDKKTQYVLLLFILLIAVGAIFSISEPSTTSFIIFQQEDTLNYKLLAGTLLLILTIYLIRKNS